MMLVSLVVHAVIAALVYWASAVVRSIRWLFTGWLLFPHKRQLRLSMLLDGCCSINVRATHLV